MPSRPHALLRPFASLGIAWLGIVLLLSLFLPAGSRESRTARVESLPSRVSVVSTDAAPRHPERVQPESPFREHVGDFPASSAHGVPRCVRTGASEPWLSANESPRALRFPGRRPASARRPALPPRSWLVSNESGFSLRC
jgi:hypothetical protein